MNMKLRAARKKLCWSMATASEKAQVSVLTYSRWESGTQEPRAYNLDLLCKAFQMSATELGFGEPEGGTPSEFLVMQRSNLVASPLSARGDDMKGFDTSRRTMLHLLGTSGAVAMVAPRRFADIEPWERLASHQLANMNTDALDHFEKLMQTCWQLSNTGELDVAEQVLSTFLPKLIEIAPYHPQVAGLVAQCLRLQGILVLQKLDITGKVIYCRQAVEYAKLSNDPDTLAAALTQTAIALRYQQQPWEALNVCMEALQHAHLASPLFRTRIYMQVAKALAGCQRNEEALFYMDLARRTFPDHPEDDPRFPFSETNIFSFSLYEGLIYLDMGDPQKAKEALESYKSLPSAMRAPERFRLEIVNYLGQADILSGDLHAYTVHLEDSITGALKLKSKKRLDEAHQILQQHVPDSWKNEPALKALLKRYNLKITKE